MYGTGNENMLQMMDSIICVGNVYHISGLVFRIKWCWNVKEKGNVVAILSLQHSKFVFSTVSPNFFFFLFLSLCSCKHSINTRKGMYIPTVTYVYIIIYIYIHIITRIYIYIITRIYIYYNIYIYIITYIYIYIHYIYIIIYIYIYIILYI